MTTERAKQIMVVINHRAFTPWLSFPFPEETPEEEQEILSVLKRMSGSSCYYEAVCKIARGEQYENRS